jgi:hypothetical protein
VSIETERSSIANGSDAAAFIRRAHRLAGVFNYYETIPLRDRCNRVHIAHKVEHMNGYDRLRIRRDLPLDILGIDGQAFIYVNQHWDRADGQRGNGCCNPSIGWHQYLVAGADAGSGQPSDQRARTAVDNQGVFDAYLFLKLIFEARRKASTTRIVPQQFPASNHPTDGY